MVNTQIIIDLEAEKDFSESTASSSFVSSGKSKHYSVIMEDNDKSSTTRIKTKDSSPLFLRGLLKENFFDTKLVCFDGIMMVHRLMLWTVSPYFGFMFDDQLPGEIAVVHLPDFSVKIIKILVRFMYKGELRIPDDKYKEVQSAMKTLGWISMETIRNLNKNEDISLSNALIGEVSEHVNQMIQTIESDDNSTQNFHQEQEPEPTSNEQNNSVNLDQVQANLESDQIHISDKSVQCDPDDPEIQQKEITDVDNDTETFKSKSTQYDPEDFNEKIDQEPEKESLNNEPIVRDIECQTNIEIKEKTEKVQYEKCDLIVNNSSTETHTHQEMILEKEEENQIEQEFDSIQVQDKSDSNSESEMNIEVIDEDKELRLIENVEISELMSLEKMSVKNVVNEDDFQIQTKDTEIPADQETSNPEIVNNEESADPNSDIETQIISEEMIKMSQDEERTNLAQKIIEIEIKSNFELEQKLKNPAPTAIVENPSKVNKLSSVKRNKAKILTPRTSLRIKKSIRSTRRKSLSKNETPDIPILPRRIKSLGLPEKSNKVKTTSSKGNSLTMIETTKESKSEKQSDPDNKKSQNISKKLSKIVKDKKLEKPKMSISEPNADADKDAEVKSPIKKEKEPKNVKVKTPIKTPIKNVSVSTSIKTPIKNVSVTPIKKELQTEDKSKKNEISNNTRRISMRQNILKGDQTPILNIDTDSAETLKGLRKSGIKRKNALTIGEIAQLRAGSNKKGSKLIKPPKTTTILTPENEIIKKRKSEDSQQKLEPKSPAKKKLKISTTEIKKKMSIEIWDKSTRCSKCKIFYKTPIQALGCLGKHKKTRCWLCFDEIAVENLDNHLNKSHPNQIENDLYNYNCLFCESSFENYNSLMVHIKKHKISEEK